MKHLLFSLLLPLSLAGTTNAAELLIAGKGTAAIPIVIARDTTPRNRQAAQELAEYIGRMAGTKPAVLEAGAQAAPASAIWIGVQPEMEKLFPGTSFEFQHPEEILIKANEKHLIIAGRDVWDPANPDLTTREGVVKGKQQEYGTVNAVYTFLQEQLGVRWLWPGILGEDVPVRESVTVAPMEYRYHPQFRSRGGSFHYSSLSNMRGYGRSYDWTRFQRLQLDSLEMEGGHGFGDWWERYHEKHPEIFALQPDGTRSGFPNPRTVKICVSNPKVWDLWMEGVAESLAQDPGRTLFNASANDGWASGHCVCEKCSAWDDPNGEPRLFNWYKQNAIRPALSDRELTFANKLGELLEQKYPGKGYRVLIMSYGHTRPVPVKARPAANVVVSMVANFLGRTTLVDRGSTRGDTYRAQFEGWAKIVPSLLWRPNTGSPAGWQQGLPDITIQQTIRDIKDVAAAHGEGIFIDAVWEHWATQGPEYYMMAQLFWNPSADAQALLADYYERGFGPAAAAVREYYEAMEQARMAFTGEKPDADRFEFPALYTPALLEAAQTRLEKAAGAVPADSVYAKRVAFVQAGLTHTRLMVENIQLMKGYWVKKDEAAAAKVRANWDEMSKNALDHPFSINWNPIRPKSPRALGLHPEDPKPKPPKKVKQANDLDLN